jgi:hypothetical protein
MTSHAVQGRKPTVFRLPERHWSARHYALTPEKACDMIEGKGATVRPSDDAATATKQQ